jgi:hypothetical protein
MNKFILRDSTSRQFDDLITFKENVDLIEIKELIENLKNTKEDYTNEDIYKELDKLGEYEIQYIGWLDVIEY